MGIFTPSEVFAHILEKDGPIEVHFHLEPNHDPVAGEDAFLYFTITNNKSDFALENCNCSIKISDQTKNVIQEVPYTPTLIYQFPQKGAYIISVEGTPKQTDDFPPFEAEFPQWVERESNNLKSINEIAEIAPQKPSATIIFPLIISLSVVTLLLLYIFIRYRDE